jgi:hypothetical protein
VYSSVEWRTTTTTTTPTTSSRGSSSRVRARSRGTCCPPPPVAGACPGPQWPGPAPLCGPAPSVYHPGRGGCRVWWWGEGRRGWRMRRGWTASSRRLLATGLSKQQQQKQEV